MATIKKRNEIIPTNSETINVKPEVDPTDNAVPFLIGNIGLWYYRTFFSHYHSRLKEKPNEPKKEFAIWLQREYKPALESIWENYSEVSENSFGTIGFNEQFKVKTIYPGLVCGIGYEHELGFENEFKLGFSFDHTTGLPYIPGSSVKGTLRSAFRHNSYPKSILEDWVKAIDQPSTEKSYPKELIGMDNGLDANPGGLKDHLIQIIEHTSWENLENQIFEGKPYSNGDPINEYKTNVFFDAFISGNENENVFFLADDYITCHQNKKAELSPFTNPNPVRFLKVRSAIEFTFGFRLFETKIMDGVIFTSAIKKELFKQILLDLGIGAKTNVGYGQFKT